MYPKDREQGLSATLQKKKKKIVVNGTNACTLHKLKKRTKKTSQ